MGINKTSANALIWFSGILIVIGWLVMSPSGAFFFFVLSAIFAVVPAMFGTGKIRFVAIALLAIAIFSSIDRYPDYKRELERLRSVRETAGMQVIERS